MFLLKYVLYLHIMIRRFIYRSLIIAAALSASVEMAAGEPMMQSADASGMRTAQERGMQTARENLQLEPPENTPEEYRNAWAAAAAFLEGLGQPCERLRFRYGDGRVAAFEDYRNKCYAWVDVRLSEIVAYGIGTRMWSGKKDGDGPVADIFQAYGTASASASHSVAGTNPAAPDSGASGQLPGLRSFAQNAPYNALIPGISGKKCISGCGSVALAEILSFYRYPEQAEGTGRLFIQDRDSTLALGGRIIDWNNPDMPELILRCAASIHTRLGLRNSSSSIIDLRAALICNWHYSPTSTYLGNIPFERMLRIVRSEIDAGRPVVLGGGDHSFLCDGYRGDFLHFIWGWNGYCDGYYDAARAELPFDEILFGIEPLREPGDSISVHVRKAGTLASLIPENQRNTISYLKVSGKLDGADIALIRTMAGAPSESGSTAHGILTGLDLSEARIMGGKSAYLVQEASGRTMSSSMQNLLVGTIPGTTREWNLGMMDEKEWKQFCALRLNRGDGYRITRDMGATSIEYFTQTDVIGESMFSDCSNLRTVWLPANIYKIKRYAFGNCRALEQLHAGDGIRREADYARDCPRLTSSNRAPLSPRGGFFR